MGGKNMGFEIVFQECLPFGHRSGDPLRKRDGRNARPNPGISLARGNTAIRLYHSDPQPPQIEFHGSHHLAASRTKLGRIAHEKGRIASQCCGTVDQLPLRKLQPE